ncbi:hypothetical protein B0T14DRAFT_531029 [Immersiella caudata]|uniref:Uncharacterized protein n=1 Tax=Immersiella caudata TaxID=314043 RepID=A0AA39THS2_9PEZI|nr:hypothetical protein B0T14DRAFT_531029 [Immersiella caudata]
MHLPIATALGLLSIRAHAQLGLPHTPNPNRQPARANKDFIYFTTYNSTTCAGPESRRDGKSHKWMLGNVPYGICLPLRHSVAGAGQVGTPSGGGVWYDARQWRSISHVTVNPNCKSMFFKFPCASFIW